MTIARFQELILDVLARTGALTVLTAAWGSLAVGFALYAVWGLTFGSHDTCSGVLECMFGLGFGALVGLIVALGAVTCATWAAVHAFAIGVYLLATLCFLLWYPWDKARSAWRWTRGTISR